MNLKAQKIIAREILLLLGAIVVSGLIYGGLSLYSLYYEHQFRELSSKNYSIQSQMDSLQRVVSEDKWEKGATLVRDNRPPLKLVGTPPLPKGLTPVIDKTVSPEKQAILDQLNGVKQKHGSKWTPPSDAVRLDNEGLPIPIFHKNGFVIPENERDIKVVSWKDLKREDSLKAVELLKEDSIKKGDELKPWEIAAVELLKEDSIKKVLVQPLQLQHEQIEAAINVARQKYLEREDINYFTLIALCIIVIILYPVRGLYFVVRWAIRTLKQPANIK